MQGDSDLEIIRYYLAKGQSLETLCNLTSMEKIILYEFIKKDIQEDKERYEG